MPRINLLDRSVAELIAAGEVVERPASVVKELLENSIDAGATAITVEIEDGGISLIRIGDNGCGITFDDLPKAFLRHATSKVFSQKDLESITTLGFRGEALASICAVSKVEIITKTPEGETGTLCTAIGGEVFPPQEVGCPDGTTITVRDIFYNTPARMKFLKKNSSEGGAIAQVVEKCALSNPNISIKFVKDGQVKLQTSGSGELISVIRAIYGREFSDNMLKVSYTMPSNISVEGYISKPSFSRPSRTYQTFFINSRYVNNKTCMAAVEQGCKGSIMTGKFPACVLNISIDYSSVDINVHPAKTQVRFSNEKEVFNAVYFAAKSAITKVESPLAPHTEVDTISSAPTPMQQERFGESTEEFSIIMEGENQSQSGYGFNKPIVFSAAKISSPDIYVEETPTQLRWTTVENNTFYDKKTPSGFDIININDKKDAVKFENNNTSLLMQSEKAAGSTKILGEIFETYIVIEHNNALLLVDKHAADERLIYQKVKATADSDSRQLLLSPEIVIMPHQEYLVLIESLDIVLKLGFLIEDFGDNTVIVREVPISLNASDISLITLEIADKLLKNHHDLTPDLLEELYCSIACRAALKAGDKNTMTQLERVVELLKDNPKVLYCPHGRPVFVEFSKNQLEKLFGRQG